MIGGNRSLVTPRDRDNMIRLYQARGLEIAQVYATRLGLRPNYAYRLMLERGLVPRAYRNWGKLRETT